ncbi:MULTISPECIES: bifunctional methylenetetrahydrofolate dehydrogenase/methenyltetrahydrofolate cyclohydrolase FolD [unclassified Colwellia]|jgi:methylenetetrahydrofolate dehydrogenase (NADP+)/methenyltetrahydrofolate cyclohydrolase|uniref:bifunctional methylenetetrahydrofolate dehydrogenase/methenyltetrahydrofolate cyclohydrolase FolD n=1 Tax=unclassified Colwellia TaxID=196834 RepID=UPI0015F4D6EC|nr:MULTISPECIES: bifunctional methylenetetrahydrofolate dehydrogenase/methenyltetrahydrofolate cyclohydrolase FolD [unclassified Colwellia]MBA6378477.1 bifunctional methylenetetrahydrofolate dehydrogenase/methenyltetrahydrofolate cyclohydrolase FolD [Colwellia sp. BRX10-7]MBA6386811.1 bifunctional methylenetetrahydrofolate dehydrogenase/methenyltetrahydrofolate cyclohydrolase FolD [Colwellia sp. BRX10-2]MBA6400290.1 bifunctional methylenetetrahydrofolate dehydrogenase/methenyltetrahydrofolate cy
MIIDGKQAAADLRKTLTLQVAHLKKDKGIVPGLTVVLVGEDPASEVYVRNKIKQTRDVGMISNEIKLPHDTSQIQLLAELQQLNSDDAVHGILVQLPLPKHIDESVIIAAIAPHKDVDGFHAMNSGRLLNGEPGALVPCTPQGCIILAKQHLGEDLSGLHAVVIGRSNIVGKPVALLLLQENCTVTIAHSRTKNLAGICQQADILIAAVGRANFVQASWVKPGATVIDVGINHIEDENGKAKLVGDVDFANVAPVCGAITPVPGGVGPMTIACLLKNTLIAASTNG